MWHCAVLEDREGGAKTLVLLGLARAPLAGVSQANFESEDHSSRTNQQHHHDNGPVTFPHTNRRPKKSFAMSEKSHRLYVKGKHIS